MAEWHEVAGGVTAPKGYQAAGIKAGLKPSGAPDLALIASDVDAIGAGVFTTSCVRAACVDFDLEVLRSNTKVRAILCNAGQANASTGEEGWRNAVETAELVKKALATDAGVLVASTGVIGRQLRMDLMRPGITNVVEALSATGGEDAAKAIVTTDLVTKSIALEGSFNGSPVRIGGISKGSGMIHPNMATMLSFVTCDAAVAPQLWQEMVGRAADKSFNQITVDGDTSTNDMLLALSNGQSGTPEIAAGSADAEKLEAMLTEVCIFLAKAIARDGEGATCLIEVTVTGAADQKSAQQVAKTIAGSSLVKSAVFGRDPNWGRIAAAAGRSGIQFDQAQLRIEIGEFLLMDRGQPLEFDRAAVSAYLKAKAAASLDPNGGQSVDHPVSIEVSIGNGNGSGTSWGCDLSYDYVKINAEYTT